MRAVSLLESAITSEFYQEPLPAFIWPVMESMYQSIFCSLPHLRAYGSLSPQTQVWVGRRRDGVIIALLVFEIQQRTVRVFNEVCSLSAIELSAFAQALFQRQPQLSAIILHAIRLVTDTLNPGLPYPNQQIIFSEDYVLSLPHSERDYLAGLSRHTREKIRYHLARSRRKQPSLTFRLVRDQLIEQTDIDAVILLSRARMASKGRHFGIDSMEEGRLHSLLQQRGWLALIEIDQVICAGLLCTVSGEDVFMHVIAHDPRHDDLRLGFLCCYLAIQSAIAERMARFHFLWGHYEYKTRLGGKEQPLSKMVLYKSRLHMAHHPLLMMRHLLTRARRMIRQWRR
jgi:CelD/BcsL family acetyltransferase involved in cellulose biosynthesis